MIDLKILPVGFTKEKISELLTMLINQGKTKEEAENLVSIAIDSQNAFDRFEKENAETKEEAILINKEIEKFLKEYSKSEILSDGSLALYSKKLGIFIRHTRKDLLPKVIKQHI